MMIEKAQIAFSTNIKASDKAKDAADMVLLTDSLEDVVMAVTKGRSYKDHLMKFLALQLPASVAAVGLVLMQAFLYDTILVTAAFVFLINLIYFPIGVVCITRENAAKRWEDMQHRWKSDHYPGTRTLTGYMRAEYMKFTILVLALFQLGALATLYYQADHLFTLVHEELDWHKEDPLFVDQDWLDDHAAIAPDYELNDLTDKGQMFLILFQTFAFMQIFGILNARRPSYKDVNPFDGISILTCVCLILLCGFQFGLVALPAALGYGTITPISNLLCLGMGACSTIWFVACKVLLKFIIGDEKKLHASM